MGRAALIDPSPRPRPRCGPWNGSAAARTWSCAARQGTGKTFFLEALGQLAVEAGRKVAWFTLESLGALVRRHRADDSMAKAVTRILRADLVVVDDIGLLPVGPDARRVRKGIRAGDRRAGHVVAQRLGPPRQAW